MTTLTKVAYFQSIASLGSELVATLLEEHGTDADAILDAADEAVRKLVGSNELAIYPHYHLPILQFSTHGDYFVDEYGTEMAGDILRTEGLDGLHAAIATHCIESDLRDWLSDNVEDIVEELIEETGEEADEWANE